MLFNKGFLNVILTLPHSLREMIQIHFHSSEKWKTTWHMKCPFKQNTDSKKLESINSCPEWKKNICVLFQVFQSLANPSESSPAKIRRSGNVEDHDHDNGDDDKEEEEGMNHVADKRSNGHGTKNKMFCWKCAMIAFKQTFIRIIWCLKSKFMFQMKRARQFIFRDTNIFGFIML